MRKILYPSGRYFPRFYYPDDSASAPHRIIQPALTASFITFVCSTGACAASVIQLVCVLQVISRQWPQPALAVSPPRLELSLQHSQRGPGHQGRMVTSIRGLGASVSSQERSPLQAVASQPPRGGFLWGKKLIFTWFAVPQISGCDSLQRFRRKMATCCCSGIVLSARHAAPLDTSCLAKAAGILESRDDPGITQT